MRQSSMSKAVGARRNGSTAARPRTARDGAAGRPGEGAARRRAWRRCVTTGTRRNPAPPRRRPHALGRSAGPRATNGRCRSSTRVGRPLRHDRGRSATSRAQDCSRDHRAARGCAAARPAAAPGRAASPGPAAGAHVSNTSPAASASKTSVGGAGECGRRFAACTAQTDLRPLAGPQLDPGGGRRLPEDDLMPTERQSTGDTTVARIAAEDDDRPATHVLPPARSCQCGRPVLSAPSLGPAAAACPHARRRCPGSTRATRSCTGARARRTASPSTPARTSCRRA